MKKRFVAYAGIALLAVGCVTTNLVLVDPAVHLAKTCATAVRLYTSADQVTTPFVRIALLDATGKTNDGTSDAELIRSMRKTAAEVGANGLLLEPIEEPGALVTIIGEVAKTGTERKAKATAIYVPADSTRTRSTCSSK